MASEQISQNEFITQAVAEAAKVMIQTMATASTPRQDKYRTQDEGIHNEAAYIQLEDKG